MNKLTLAAMMGAAILAILLAVAWAGLGLSGANASGLYVTVVPTKTSITTPVAATAGSAAAGGSLTVVGVGRAKVIPDVVRIQVGVETISSTVAAATVENDRVMAAVLAALKKEGIAEKDIQTAYYTIYPEYKHDASRDVAAPAQIIGYRVSNSVTITIHDTKDMKKVSAVLEAVVQAGANSISGITFSVKDLQAVEDEARTLAVADAKRRAEKLAALADVKLGRVLIVSEVITGAPDVTSKALDYAQAAPGGGPAILPGEQEYVVSIQVTYAIE